MRSETEVQRAIMDYLKLRGIFAFRVNNIPPSMMRDGKRVFRSFGGMRGVADIIGIMPGGRLLAIEVKSETGRPSPDQVAFGEAINAAGGLWFVARGIEDVQDKRWLGL
jgi:hypothetical protein